MLTGGGGRDLVDDGFCVVFCDVIAVVAAWWWAGLLVAILNNNTNQNKL